VGGCSDAGEGCLYDAILHDRPLPNALTVIADFGLTGIDINSRGSLPPCTS
jgi:hypothetical protein